jgi:hypothetical protein
MSELSPDDLALLERAKRELEMKRERQRRHYQRNRERLLEAGREYREQNRLAIKLRRCGVYG